MLVHSCKLVTEILVRFLIAHDLFAGYRSLMNRFHIHFMQITVFKAITAIHIDRNSKFEYEPHTKLAANPPDRVILWQFYDWSDIGQCKEQMNSWGSTIASLTSMHFSSLPNSNLMHSITHLTTTFKLSVSFLIRSISADTTAFLPFAFFIRSLIDSKGVYLAFLILNISKHLIHLNIVP